MDQITQLLTNPYVLAAMTVLATPLAGALLSGIDRKVTARIQGRVGPPVLQPFYDVAKLLRKEPIALNRFQILYAFLHLAFMVMVVVLLVLGQDMLMILFAHAFSAIALILGAMCVRSPYSRIGAQRKILQLLAYEPILVLMVIGMYLAGGNHAQGGSFLARDVIASGMATGRPLLASMPLLFLAFLMAVAIKLEKSPFDVASSHHAHQELVKGVTLEYSGPYLAIVEITHFIEMAVLFGILAAFWATNIWIGLAIASAAFFLQVVLDNTFARLTPMWMVKYMWTVPMTLAVTNIIWLYYRWNQ